MTGVTTVNKALKRFVELVQAEGMTVEQGGKHLKVLDRTGNRVGTVSTTGETNALRQAVRDLARQKLFANEKEARSIKF